MADIIEVFDAIPNVYEFTQEELEVVRAKKNLVRGAFNKMIFLEEIK